MLRSEKRSLFRFLTIYLSSTFSLFFLATFIFYGFQKHQIIDRQHSELKIKSEEIREQLRQLTHHYEEELVYPQHRSYDSAIYNLDKAYIFGTTHYENIEWEQGYYQKENKLFYINRLQPYYLGAAYLVVSQSINEEPLNELFCLSALLLFLVGIFFMLLGLFLGKLFIAPMKVSMEMMNKFIEDTTHELNTPISTILTNIELLESIHDCSGKQEMRRIDIASKTLSRLYEDLTYLKLNHNYHREMEQLNISQLLEERIEFFNTLIEAKKIKVIKKNQENIFLEMDRNDAIRLMDNLLSNAIKYNKKSGLLAISLTDEKLLVQNSGVGIKAEKIKFIQRRFKRANSSEGGFGIGLDIIGQVVNRYNFTFQITSTQNKLTEVCIVW